MNLMRLLSWSPVVRRRSTNDTWLSYISSSSSSTPPEPFPASTIFALPSYPNWHHAVSVLSSRTSATAAASAGSPRSRRAVIAIGARSRELRGECAGMRGVASLFVRALDGRCGSRNNSGDSATFRNQEVSTEGAHPPRDTSERGQGPMSARMACVVAGGVGPGSAPSSRSATPASPAPRMQAVRDDAKSEPAEPEVPLVAMQATLPERHPPGNKHHITWLSPGGERVLVRRRRREDVPVDREAVREVHN